ncbi:hypothetical protein SBDP1_580022 [Syntrophobacter sp. SbD1]|nr:hypothetical protein SBDP1_580022 [Syntrophobacter sp. SbD1]
MTDRKERKSFLLDEAKKLRELLDQVIVRLESGEGGPAGSGAGHRTEIDEFREKIIELLQRIEEIQMEEIMEKVRERTADASKKVQDVLGNIGLSFDDLSRKAQDVFGDWFGKCAISRDELKAIIMSEKLTAEYFETMRRRNWTDQGIQESLDVLRQILLSRI